MAMRPTNLPRLANRVYEQFSPSSEWGKKRDADILLVFLPGFVKDNIRVTIEPNDIIRVAGEHQVAGNKWKRFQKDFKIPENCNIRSGIGAKFDSGILTITMPWKAEIKATRPTSTPAPAPAPKPQEANAKPSSQANVIPSQAASSASNTKKAESTSSQAKSTPKQANLPNFTSTIGANKSTTDLPSLEPPRPQNVKDDKTSTTTSSETKEIKRAEMYPNTTEKSVRNENIEGIEKKDKEPNQDEKVIKKIVEKRDEEKSGFGGYSMEEYKQVVKRLARGLNENEERESMVNMGVAVLVLVALGAYVSYTSFGK